MRLCKYKSIFGNPGIGVHSYRLFNLPVVDVVFTMIAAYLIAMWKRWAFWKTFLGLFIFGEILHYMFCVDTVIISAIKKLFSKNKKIIYNKNLNPS